MAIRKRVGYKPAGGRIGNVGPKGTKVGGSGRYGGGTGPGSKQIRVIDHKKLEEFRNELKGNELLILDTIIDAIKKDPVAAQDDLIFGTASELNRGKDKKFTTSSAIKSGRVRAVLSEMLKRKVI